MAHLINDSSGEIINIPRGDSSIGRGPLLKVKDKRVSRNHALLRLRGGSFSICPKHVNPCFHLPAESARGSSTYTVLPKDKWRDLDDGDLISLLPDGELAFRISSHVPEEQWTDSADSSGTTPIVSPCKLSPPHPAAPEDPPISTASHASTTATPELVSKSSRQSKPLASPPPTQEPSGPPLPPTHKSDNHDIMDDLLFGDVEEPIAGKEREGDVSESTRGPSAAVSKPAKALGHGESASLGCNEGGGEGASGPPTPPLGSRGDPKAASVDNATTITSSSSSFKPAGSTDKAASVDNATTTTTSSLTSVSSKPAGSTNKHRVLPSWLASLGEDMSPTPATTTTTTTTAKRKRAPSKTSRKPPTHQQKSTSPVDNSSPDPPPAKRRGKQEEKTLSPASPDPINKKPPCPFGSKCYRKNPAHFREYTHDFAAADSDSGSGSEGVADGSDHGSGKPVCPYGANCYRKNPAHLLEYVHPAAGTRQSSRSTKGKKKSVLAGESDEDDQPNTYDYNDSFIDDNNAGNSSSVCSGDEEDSDWMPEEMKLGGHGEEEEDVAGLIADAEEFIGNKKMRR